MGSEEKMKAAIAKQNQKDTQGGKMLLGTAGTR